MLRPAVQECTMTTQRKTNITGYIPVDDAEWLEKQPGSRNETLREAIETLREQREGDDG